MSKMKSGSPFLYDDLTDDVVGIKDKDGEDKLFTFGGGSLAQNVVVLTGSRVITDDDAGGNLVYSGSGNIALTLNAGNRGGLSFCVTQLGSGVISVIQGTATALTTGVTTGTNTSIYVQNVGTDTYLTYSPLTTSSAYAYVGAIGGIPTTGLNDGDVAHVTGINSGYSDLVWDSTNSYWWPKSAIEIAITSTIAGSATIVETAFTAGKISIPGILLHPGLRISMQAVMSDTGTTDTNKINLRFGSAGSTADTLIAANSDNTNTRRLVATTGEVALTSTTAFKVLSPSGAGFANGISSTAMTTGSITAAATAYVTPCQAMGGATDTPSLESIIVTLHPRG